MRVQTPEIFQRFLVRTQLRFQVGVFCCRGPVQRIGQFAREVMEFSPARPQSHLFRLRVVTRPAQAHNAVTAIASPMQVTVGRNGRRWDDNLTSVRRRRQRRLQRSVVLFGSSPVGTRW